jgi:hypothetical protein
LYLLPFLLFYGCHTASIRQWRGADWAKTVTGETRKNRPATAGRDGSGRFANGNPGRRPGSRNRVNAALDKLFSGSAAKVARATIQAAQDGDTTAMRLVLERAFPAPKDRRLDPIDLPDNPAEAMAAIVAAVAGGDLLPSDGEKLAALVKARADLSALSELEARVAALEGKT